VELVIAEKPSVARDLARVLGVRGKGEHAFEGDAYVITWCVGHLVELDEPASYDPAWKAWRLDRLPMLPEEFRLRGSAHARDQLSAVSKLLRDRRFAAVINACDAGREGELIFRYVYQHARSRLVIRRLWVSSLTDEAIRRGFARLAPGTAYEALADAARSRSEADWLVGLNATRALTARGREAGHDALFSIGRVQTPTLAMLVERERAITSFVPRDYWEVTLAAGDAGEKQSAAFSARWRSGSAERLASAPLADAVVERDRAIGSAVVEKVTAKTTHEPPPQLFDLTSLQRTANRRYGWSAQRTLELAQALYERHKAITYPRTDARHLSTDVAAELAGPLAALAELPTYAAFAQPLVSAPPRLGRRFVDDSKVRDHHAIIPTSAAPRGLDRDEARLYDLIARRFLGAFFPDAEIALTEAWLRVGPAVGAPPTAALDKQAILEALPAMPDRYVARGRVRVVAGWQEVAGIGAEPARPAKDEASGDEAEREPIGALPPLAEGQIVPARFAAAAKQTTPPSRHTEATLLGAMESAGKAIDDEALRAAMKDTGLGTPATRASIIETLLRRAYVTRDGRHLVPTATGIGLIATVEGLAVASLASPELTGSWEARLAKIARKEDARAAFMTDIRRYVTAIVDAIRGAAAPPPPPPGSESPRRDRAPNDKWKSKRRGPPRSKSAAPARTNAPARANLPPARTNAPARTNVAPAHTNVAPARTNLPPARTNAAARTNVAPARTNAPAHASEAALVCPRCARGTLITGARGWGCSRWRDGCGFVVWFVTAGRKLTAAQLRDLVTKGKTRKAAFDRGDGRLVLDPAGPGGARFEPG
jgi:DNA topoisomerase III